MGCPVITGPWSVYQRWRSAPPIHEAFVAFTDGTLTRALVSRESPAEPTNYFLRTFDTGTLTPFTKFPNPFPQFAGVKHEVVRYKRADGLSLSGTLYLPPGWTPDHRFETLAAIK